MSPMISESTGLPSERKLLSRFDELLATGHVLYEPTQAITHIENGFTFKFHISPVFAFKPNRVDDPPTPAPKFGPGSDIDNAHPSLVLTTLHGTHFVVFNKFCIIRPQFLLLTEDSYRRQTDPLDADDLRAAWTMLTNDKPQMMIYNGGPKAGCSRVHKHLQIWARQPSLFPDVEPTPTIPFKYFLHRFDATIPLDLEQLVEIYNRFVKKCRELLGVVDGETVPHNVVLVKEWLLVIPRRKGAVAGVSGVSANAAGMVGMEWVARQEQVDAWMEIGPGNVLADLGVPA
ncbi:ATP adenylyltransferase-domain-containing protein [Geopyxis carbonaria]|nr:ATP adenylyltransferase-domain-containing protein [Geopyxis carbonaria]